MRFQIYTGDHEPPHVHAVLPGGEVVVYLDEYEETIVVRDTYGVSPHDVRRAVTIAAEHFETLLEAWNRLHR